MDFFELSDVAIEKEIGHRIKSLRLEQNRTQEDLSKSTMLSLRVIKSLESGKGKLSSLIAVLRELKALDQLNHFIPEVEVSPLQLVRMQGKKRQRASGKKEKDRI